MDKELLNSIVEVLLPVLATILTAVFSWVGIRIKSLYAERVNTQIKEEIAEQTVKYVEQIYATLHGKEKFNKAVEVAADWLSTKGLTISEVELTILIEAAVHSLNLESIFIDTAKTLNE